MKYIALVLNLLLTVSFYSCRLATVAPPNIVFILADDLGFSQIACYGTDYYQTPNIDKLALEGMRFTNAYAACPVCSSTRASIMTGKYPARLHLTDYIHGKTKNVFPLAQPQWQRYLPLEELTFAEILKEGGNRTALFGKWHLSQEKKTPGSLPFNPDKQGFDESFVTYKAAKSMLQPWQQAEVDAHNVDTITNLPIDFLERNQSNPFFLFVLHNTIHTQLLEKAETIKKYENLKQIENPEKNPIIAVMIERLNKSCGEIINKIDDLGLDDNTIIIYFADNGRKEQYAKQTPFRAGKGWLFEGGIKEPLIVKWKDVIIPGSSSEALINSIDFLPTFLEMAEIDRTLKNNDGKSFVPALLNSETEIHPNLYWRYPHNHTASGTTPAGAIHSCSYKLIEWYEPKLLENEKSVELFDLTNDQGETIDLSDNNPEKVGELLKALNDWRLKV